MVWRAAPYAKCFNPSLIPLVVYMAHICLCAHIKFRKKNIFFLSIPLKCIVCIVYERKKNHCIIKHITHAHYIDRQKKSLQKLFLRSRHVLCEFIWTTAERYTRDMFFFVYARFESPILLYLDLTPYKEASLPGYQHCARIIFKRNIVLLLARRYHMRE